MVLTVMSICAFQVSNFSFDIHPHMNGLPHALIDLALRYAQVADRCCELTWVQHRMCGVTQVVFESFCLLCFVQDLMKTESGKKMAAQRHEFMESYVEQFLMEWQGKA